MKRSIEGLAEGGELLLCETREAITAHLDAHDGEAPLEVIERLRLLADSLFHAVVDLQFPVTGKLPDSIH
jgi:hypothetical protein